MSIFGSWHLKPAPFECYNFYVENKHAYRSGCVLLWRGTVRNEAGFSPIAVTAVISAVALVAVVGWQATRTLQAENAASAIKTYLNSGRIAATEGQGANVGDSTGGYANATSSVPNVFSNVGNQAFGQLVDTYVALKKSGEYTEAQGDSIASDVASAMRAQVSYTPYTESGLKTDPDTSYKRILTYRSDLREALAPLLLNTGSELDIFGRYLDTHDTNNLKVLEQAAGRYRKAAANAAAVTVPEDALEYHVGIENALLKFAVTLESLIKNADDPMATLALLRTYNDAEKNVFTSFDALASYQKRKIP